MARNGSARSRQAVRGGRQVAGIVNDEVQNLISTVEDLTSRIGEAVDPELARLRAQTEAAVSAAKEVIADRAEQLRDQAKQLADQGEDYIRERPWSALALTALAGIALGFWVAHRASD